MPNRRDIRRLAMQILYQMDLRGPDDHELVREGLCEGPDAVDVQEEAFQLAQAAWVQRAEADTMMTDLAPDWPTHRQPPVDRAVLRLAYYEISSSHAPAKVVINEAVELAKTFGSEQSPAFINGVLDKVAKRLTADPPNENPETAS